ncbi:MAG: AAA family ATPase [Deinococcus sp.]|nr:AAA family ATPase [Deinococcus sp.]
MKWTQPINVAGVLVGDVTSDGKLEVVAVGQYPPEMAAQRQIDTSYPWLFVFSGTGKLLIETGLPLPIPAAVSALDDFDGDGILDIALATSSGYAYLYRGTGKDERLQTFHVTQEIAGEPPDELGTGRIDVEPIAALPGKRVLARLNTARRPRNPRGAVVFDYVSAQPLWYYDIGPGTSTFNAVGDLDGDGDLDMVMGGGSVDNGAVGTACQGVGTPTSDTYMYTIAIALDDQCRELWAANYGTTSGQSQGINTEVIADLDGDGVNEVLSFESHDDFYLGTDQVHKRRAATGEIIATYDYVHPGFGTGQYHWAVGDLDGDGRREVMITKPGVTGVTILDSELRLLRQGNVSGLVLAANDLTGDGQAEILLRDRVQEQGVLRVVDAALRELWSHPFPAEISQAVPADIDADGINEIVVAAGQLYVLGQTMPWALRYWPWVVSPLVLLGAVGAGWQRARFQLALTRKFNPYVAGRAITEPHLFYGREQLLKRILGTLHNNSVLLYGERRIGKTSLLHQIRRRLLTDPDPQYWFIPAYIYLAGVGPEQFFSTLAAGLAEAARAHLKELPPLHYQEPGYDTSALVRDLRQLIAALQAPAGKRQVKLALLIDEVDQMNSYPEAVNQGLRSVFMQDLGEHLAAVIAGVDIKRQWEGRGSPWYNFFQQLAVPPLDQGAAERLIREPVRGIFYYQPAAVEQILDICKGNPFWLQRLCLELVNRALQRQRRTITLQDVKEVWTEVTRQES